ncbi:kinesin-like protein KIN-5A [Phalaenopsis equestris]|uniref:kinesin-like protein KIN-5A n=1 Tax=Phalaenopsis equestris TaxID=78828 RepID=UPI0009E400E3|nr:kinesin-like protein KIN-5A [Phalaenopsis equestris]
MDASQRKGCGVPMSPTQIPRPSEKYGKDSRLSEANGHLSGKNDKEKGINVQVILRCRPLSEEEESLKMPAIISCNEMTREVLAIQNFGNKQIDRKFVFDKVFGPKSQQLDLFNQSISPIVDEVLEGFNCTIFAYGQTGTGKTYTMEGGKKAKHGEFSSDAGVIPRSVRQIFESLEAQCVDYSMKVSFLELYNEELIDLLASDELKLSDDKSKKPIAFMEDGKGGVFIRGLEEDIVCSADEIYKILDAGSVKRHTAETLLNKQSSRSHSIFSITVQIKEVTLEGEELIKIGKLNLVDLAGSENILRSGSREGRAREAGEMNKSLLTLGRVINALVENNNHSPYRESKLTRLLRDSLGGNTKTCIIATISPSIQCLEETLSTLDYANRAKNIKNKPELNQKMMKSAMMKELCSEINRLKQEVNVAREKNGIYIPRDQFQQEKAKKKVGMALAEKIEKMEFELEQKEKKLIGLQELYDSRQLLSAQLSEKLDIAQKKLKENENMIVDQEERCQKAKCTIREKDYVIMNLLHSERALAEHARGLHLELEHAAADISGLCGKIEHKDKMEERNKITVQKFQSQLTQQLHNLHKVVLTSAMQQENQLKKMEEEMRSFVSTKAKATTELIGWVEKLKALYGSGMATLDGLAGELDQNSRITFGKLYSQMLTNSSSLDECFRSIAWEAENLLTELESSLSSEEDKLNTFAKLQREGHLRTVEATRSISITTTDFFHTLDVHVSKLNKIIEENQTEQNQQLSELERKLQECAANDEEQLLEKLAELLASSNSRKKKLVQTAVDTLRVSAVDGTNNIQKELSNAQNFASFVKEKWALYMEETENHHLEDTAAVEKGRSCLEEGLKECMKDVKIGSLLWKNAQDSLSSLAKGHVASVESIVWSGMEANQLIRANLSSAATTALEQVEVGNKSLQSSIEGSLKLDHDACVSVSSFTTPSQRDLWSLRNGHYQKIVEITDDAGRCLEREYKMDEPSSSTPRMRDIILPSGASIEELKTPAFEELLKGFGEANYACKQENGDIKHLYTAYEVPSQALRDYRVPLTTQY